MKTLLFILLPLFAFGQVQDSTDVAIDTSSTVINQNKFEVSKAQNVYTFKQFQDENTFVQTQISGKKAAVQKLTAILKQLKSDEALLVKQLALIRARKKEIATARDLYK